MKKLLVVILMLSSLSVVQAQRAFEQPEHYVGVKAGSTISFMTFTPTVAQSMEISYVVGAMYRLVNEKYFGLQIEANYAERGWAETSGYSRTLRYVEVPFLSHIKFGSRSFRWFFHLGPSVSLLVNDSGRDANSTQAQQSQKVKNIVDYSIMGGTGFEFHTKAGVWNLEGRYSFGLGNIFSSKAGDEFSASSNQNIYVTLAWLFPIKK